MASSVTTSAAGRPDSARIMAGAGIKAYIYQRALPTPVLAFAIRPLAADAGIMVTASHNPANDNGYKVYLGDGSQIVPPSDAEISECIAAVGAYDAIPRSDDFTTLGPEMLDQYIERAVSLLSPGPREVISVYTAMHGVGGAVFMKAAAAAGFPDPHPVVEQLKEMDVERMTPLEALNLLADLKRRSEG